MIGGLVEQFKERRVGFDCFGFWYIRQLVPWISVCQTVLMDSLLLKLFAWFTALDTKLPWY